MRGDEFAVKMEISILRSEMSRTGGMATIYIPSAERLPQLASNDPKKAISIVAALIQLFFEPLNIARKMSPEQIAQVAEELILEQMQEYGSDNLAIEDVGLFLSALLKGEYGQLYESMDSIKFFGFFDIYRQERHRVMIRHNEEKAAYYRGIGLNGQTERGSFTDFRDEMNQAKRVYLYEKEMEKKK